MISIYTIEILVEDRAVISELFGNLDSNIKLIEEELDMRVGLSESGLVLSGRKYVVQAGELLINNLVEVILKKGRLDEQDLRYNINLIKSGKNDNVKVLLDEVITLTASGKPIRAKTLGQKLYLDTIDEKDIVFGIGPAGTGKTYLAMAKAVDSFRKEEVSRIILTRPAVEAGESLGFLPGDLNEKVDPYLRPLYDALFEILGFDKFQRLTEKGVIEVAPLAYMRGRTLDSAYVILDEAQNTTEEQMKMFLTRLGYGSKAIITGDISQIDLPRGRKSGLVSAKHILKNVSDIGIVELSRSDIVRHPLVQKIIEAYEKYEQQN